MSAMLGAPPRLAPVGASDTLTLQVGGQQLSGWQRVSVTRSMDSIPASFDLEVTEKFPNTADVNVQPGQACTVMIGGDLVLTGYVDRYATAMAADRHTIRVQGRSKSCDLVDCSAFVGLAYSPSYQVMRGSALAIAQAIAAPYGVTIQSSAGPGAQIPQFNINLGETCWEIIDRLCRVSGFIAYDMPDGSMMLARAGTTAMASGFALGANIEQADISFSMDQRYSEYEGHFLSVQEYGVEGPLTNSTAGPVQYDQGVHRFRKLIVVSEQMQGTQSLAAQRALWERNRRLGRSQQFNVTCDSWRDSAGTLWAPNCLAPIAAAEMKMPNASWVIGGVAYSRDETGQHAALTLMPPEAFAPEPYILLPIPVLLQNVEGQNPTKPDAGDLNLPPDATPAPDPNAENLPDHW